jgi:hypothetical protein
LTYIDKSNSFEEFHDQPCSNILEPGTTFAPSQSAKAPAILIQIVNQLFVDIRGSFAKEKMEFPAWPLQVINIRTPKDVAFKENTGREVTQDDIRGLNLEHYYPI